MAMTRQDVHEQMAAGAEKRLMECPRCYQPAWVLVSMTDDEVRAYLLDECPERED